MAPLPVVSFLPARGGFAGASGDCPNLRFQFYKYRAPNGAPQNPVLPLLLLTAAFNRSAQCLNRQSRRVVFARRQTTERVRNFLSRQPRRIRDVHSFDHFREHGTAGKRRRATVGEEARGLDPTIAQAQTQPQTIAAYWVCLLRDCVRIG
jgi:hypothetical protein